MAAKVTRQDIEDAGFRAEQFGTPGQDWESFTQRLIERASAWSGSYLGVRYDAITDGPVFENLRSAELEWASAELWKSRAAFIDSNAASSRDAPAYADRRQYLDASKTARDRADELLQLVIGGNSAIAGTGAHLTSVETGPFARHACMGWPR